MNRVIGLDFDNTIVTYDELIHRVAVEMGLIRPPTEANKRAVRDQIRLRPGGDIEWQKVQGRVYGPLMRDAQLVLGVDTFVRRGRAAGASLYIVSHKTPFAGHDETGANLRTGALRWMSDHRFFASDGLGFREEDVFFESTREAKVARIDTLQCSVFIDDLVEVFLEPTFPTRVRKILFAPEMPQDGTDERTGAAVMRSWKTISDHVFGNAV